MGSFLFTHVHPSRPSTRAPSARGDRPSIAKNTGFPTVNYLDSLGWWPKTRGQPFHDGRGEGSLQPSNPAAAIIPVKSGPCHCPTARNSSLPFDFAPRQWCVLSRVKTDPDSIEARVKRTPIEGCFPRSPASPFVSIIIIERCLRITRSHALPQTSQSARSRSSPITTRLQG